MGRARMGESSGFGASGAETNTPNGRGRRDARASYPRRKQMGVCERSGAQPKHPPIRVGDRFGELTVVGAKYGARGGVIAHVVQCSCGASPHEVQGYNLRKGASTRCNKCAKLQANHWRKRFFGYADIMPDEGHRVRLLNRISACLQRCHSPTNKQFHHYGGRGVFVYGPWRSDRKAFLRYLIGLPGWNVPELELDRTDVDKGYEPGNLRFVSRADNCGNKRSVAKMQARILELEARIRSCKCGASPSVHDHH